KAANVDVAAGTVERRRAPGHARAWPRAADRRTRAVRLYLCTRTGARGTLAHRAHRGDLRREPELRPSLWLVSRRGWDRQRHAGAIHPTRPRRHAADAAATRVDGRRQARHAVSHDAAESAIPDRRAAGIERPRPDRSESDPPVLAKPG